MKDLLQDIECDLNIFKDFSISMIDVVKRLNLSDKKMASILQIFNTKAVIFYVLNSKKYQNYVINSEVENRKNEISTLCNEFNDVIFKEINKVLSKREIIYLIESLEKFKTLSVGYNLSDGGYELKSIDFKVENILVKRELSDYSFDKMWDMTTFNEYAVNDIALIVPFIERANGIELIEFLIATYYSVEFKTTLLGHATQRYKKFNVAPEDIQKNVVKSCASIVHYWEQNKDKISFPEQYIPSEASFFFNYKIISNPYSENKDIEKQQQEVTNYEVLFNIYQDYQIYIQGIPAKIDENSIAGAKVFLNKWNEIEVLIQEKSLPNPITEKKKQKAINLFVREKMQLHKMQEFAIKAHTSKHLEFIDYLNEHMSKYVKVFNLKKREIIVSREVYKTEKIKIILDINLKSFTEKTGFTKKMTKELMEILSILNRQNNSLSDVLLFDKKDGFELIVWLTVNNEEREKLEDFTIYFTGYLYKQLLKSLNILKRIMPNGIEGAQFSNIHQMLDEEKDNIVFKNTVEECFKWIREDNLLAEMANVKKDDKTHTKKKI